MNLLQFMEAMRRNLLTKTKFGEIMHDPEASEEEKQQALADMQAAGGYDDLLDD